MREQDEIERRVASGELSAAHTFTLMSQITQSLRREMEDLRAAFEHTHVAQTGSDDCARCGLDLRNPVHRRLNA